jgi:hypothetical protein
MSLTRSDAAIIMGMLARGDKNQDVAAWFGENPARVVEVEKGETFGIVPAAAANELPPKGAIGPKARRLRAYAADALKALQEKGPDGVAEAIKELSDGLARFDRHES